MSKDGHCCRTFVCNLYRLPSVLGWLRIGLVTGTAPESVLIDSLPEIPNLKHLDFSTLRTLEPKLRVADLIGFKLIQPLHSRLLKLGLRDSPKFPSSFKILCGNDGATNYST
ncbi:hypothetical protein WN943_027606 [Citrus x changshan-huyou]